MTRLWMGAGGLMLGACGADDPPAALLDTGWFTAEDAPGCPHQLVATSPEDGETDWIFREAPRVFASTPTPDGYDLWLLDGAGHVVPTTPVWSEADSAFDLVVDGDLQPDTAYTLIVQDCEGTSEVRFRTSPLGLPLLGEPADLVGRTYRLDLGGARWVRPEGLGSLIASFLTEPLLLGVVYADDEQIDLIGASSVVDELGQVSQANTPTWDFPLADFDPQAPTFGTGADAITLTVGDGGATAALPLTDFAVSGTLSADGTRMGGGAVAGLADTREVSGTFAGSPSAICLLAETSFQVACSPCPSDDAPFCLQVEGRELSGTEQPGLTLVDRSERP